MNCSAAHNRLLSLPDPAAVPAPLAGHLAECAACRAWHGLLVRIDGAVAAIPVPPAARTGRQVLLDQFRGPAPLTRPAAAPSRAAGGVVLVAAPSPVGKRVARHWPFGLVAAALLAGVLSWVILSGDGGQPGPVALPRDPMLERVLAASNRIEAADGAADRLEGLADLAGEIHSQAEVLSKVTPDQLDSLAGLYEKLVGDDALVRTARALSAEERRNTLPRFTKGLEDAEQAAIAAAAEAPPQSVAPLKRIADAARGSRTKLTRLQQERGGA
jgi:hypothetical protein